MLQVRYVSAAGDVVKAGGPTVKNVSGFDLCRLLVGSRGTLGFLGDVILRTWPRARCSQWFVGAVDPVEVIARLYRPTSVLWDGTSTWVLLEGDERDVAAQVAGLDLDAGRRPAAAARRRPVVGAARRDRLAARARSSPRSASASSTTPTRPPSRPVDPAVVELHRRIKERFDPRAVASTPASTRSMADRPFVDGPPGAAPDVWAAARAAAAALGTCARRSCCGSG